MTGRTLTALAALTFTATPALGPIEVEAYGPPHAWFCGFVRDWKAVMRREYPDADRSVPEIERRCRLPREARP